MKHEDATELISNILQLAIDNSYSLGYDDGVRYAKMFIEKEANNG
jgi:hypothetical protein